MSAHTEQRKLAAIMFTDMVGYSALAQRNEALALELLEEHRRVLRAVFPHHHGLEVETAGDAFLVEFVSALEAVRCAVDIQETLSERNRITPTERAIRLRIGIHVGDVVHKDGKVMGDAVNIAARIEPLASPGGICVSEDVARQIRNKVDHPLVTLGPSELKNIELPVVICRVVLPWEKQEATRSADAHIRKIAKRSVSTRMWTSALLAVVVLLLGAVGWWAYQQSGKAPNADKVSPATNLASIPSATDTKSIAVLPFVNMSADKNDEYLSDGMTDELINTLQKVKGLRVQGRISSFFFKGKNESIQKIGGQLQVKYLLGGSVSKADNKLRITAELVAVADGFQLWSTTYDRDLSDIFAIRSDVAQQVVAALKIQLGISESQSIARKPTENMEAYQLYLLGRYQLNKRTPEGFQKGIGSFQQAIEKDPNYALAHAGLGDCYALLYGYDVWPPSESVPKAKAAAAKALEFDGTLAEAHATLGLEILFYDRDGSGAEREFRQAIQLNPSYATAHQWFAWYFIVTGQFDAAIGEKRRALELDPLSLIIRAEVGQALYFARRHDNAMKPLMETLAMDPGFVRALYFLGLVHEQKSRYEDAIAHLTKAVNLSGRGTYVLAALGHAYAVAGRNPEAHKLLDELLDRAKGSYVAPDFIASIYAGLNEKDAALNWLQRAVEARTSDVVLLKVEPMYDNLRSDSRFTALLKKVGLEK